MWNTLMSWTKTLVAAMTWGATDRVLGHGEYNRSSRCLAHPVSVQAPSARRGPDGCRRRCRHSTSNTKMGSCTATVADGYFLAWTTTPSRFCRGGPPLAVVRCGKHQRKGHRPPGHDGEGGGYAATEPHGRRAVLRLSGEFQRRALTRPFALPFLFAFGFQRAYRSRRHLHVLGTRARGPSMPSMSR